MAKGNMLQGQATGKVGDIVFMVRNGQQISRVYTASGGRSGDQASIAVRRQRVRFGAASNQYLLYRNIVRGMYRTGKQTRQSDYNYFVRENVDLLPYLTKEENAAGVKCAMPGTFSRGTLGALGYDIVITSSGGSPQSYKVQSAGVSIDDTIEWTDQVSKLKDALKLAFPNARKVTFSVCKVIVQELDVPGGSQFTHSFDRGDVVFDLYEEDAIVPDTNTIGEYFDQYAPSSLSDIWLNLSTSTFADGSTLFGFTAETGIAPTLLPLVYVNVFATNDQVGDCYTSSLVNLNVPDDDSGLILYSKLRTDNHRQVAEDSYGYATGVMRTNIQQA